MICTGNYDDIPDMQFEVCETSTCENTTSIFGSKEYWTLKLSSNQYRLLFIVWGKGSVPLGASAYDDYFVVGNKFMEKYYTIFDYKNNKVGYIEAK